MIDHPLNALRLLVVVQIMIGKQERATLTLLCLVVHVRWIRRQFSHDGTSKRNTSTHGVIAKLAVGMLSKEGESNARKRLTSRSDRI